MGLSPQGPGLTFMMLIGMEVIGVIVLIVILVVSLFFWWLA
jgi:hypothetical protein